MKFDAVPGFGFVTKSGYASDHWEKLRLDERQKASIYSQIHLLYQYYHDYLAKHKQGNLQFSPTKGCELLKTNINYYPLVKYNGDIHPCQLLYSPSYTIGNLFVEDISYVLSLQNPRLVLLQKYLQLRLDLLRNGMCRGCVASAFCTGGCPAMALDYGDILNGDGGCISRKNHLLVMQTQYLHKNN